MPVPGSSSRGAPGCGMSGSSRSISAATTASAAAIQNSASTPNFAAISGPAANAIMKDSTDTHAKHGHRPGANFLARRIGDQRGQRRRDRASALQQATGDDAMDRIGHGGDDAAGSENGETADDDRHAARRGRTRRRAESESRPGSVHRRRRPGRSAAAWRPRRSLAYSDRTGSSANRPNMRIIAISATTPTERRSSACMAMRSRGCLSPKLMRSFAPRMRGGVY